MLSVWPGGSVQAQDRRDYPRVIGRPETLVYAVDVATVLSRQASRKFPQIEQSSDEGGRRTFCSTARDSPDVMLAATTIGEDIPTGCDNGEPLLVLPVGRQVFVLYMEKGQTSFSVTREQLYRALARDLPRRQGDGSLEAGFERNPNNRWKDISPDLPDIPIRVLGPPRRAVQWLTLEDLIMKPGCMAIHSIAVLSRIDPQTAAQRCLSRRTDQAISYADGSAFAARPAILPHGTEVALNERRNLGFVQDPVLLSVEAVLPSDSAIEANKFVLSRALNMVVKRNRLDTIPNLRNFVVEMTSTAAAGPAGYLLRDGLDPLSAQLLGRSALRARYEVPGQSANPETAAAPGQSGQSK